CVLLSLLCVTSFSVCADLIFFFLLIRRLPRSTLFPYTTLFRSVQSFLEGVDVVGRPEGPLTLDEVLWRRATGLPEPARRVLEAVDRKSTRLNSSHQIISYAVFCLKKKKINC